MKLLEKIKYFDEKEIRFLDIPIAQYGTKKSKRCSEKYFSLFPKSFEQKFLDTILKPLYKKHDYIFIVRTAGIGEAYLLNFMVDEIIKKYRIKSPCFVIWRKCYADMFNLYWPDIPIYYCNTPNTFLLRNRFGKYKNVPFQIVHATIEESHKAFGKFEY